MSGWEPVTAPSANHSQSLPSLLCSLQYSSMRGTHRYRAQFWNSAGERVPCSAPVWTPRLTMDQESYPNSDELDDDVFYPDDCDFPIPPLTPPSAFTQSQSYTCLLGRFQIFPLSHCCGPGCRNTDYEDKATQTLGPPSVSIDTMLPCGVTECPQRLFYGNAGFILQHPTYSLGDHLAYRRQEQSTERRIGRKLQCIGDQFHRHHLQKRQQNRNQVWSQIFLFFRNLVIRNERNRRDANWR
ncbi:bcl-2-modifying factor isoform X1 [Pelobates fuscus]|uniref:bcl-2-modifying factor isoform X1 n=2 Tax=Pelobates fuscus TaxID=191477 RepID=UPI002FE4D2DA